MSVKSRKRRKARPQFQWAPTKCCLCKVGADCPEHDLVDTGTVVFSLGYTSTVQPTRSVTQHPGVTHRRARNR